MQNFTPIGVIVADISVTEQIHAITADLILYNTHTSVEFVDNDTKHLAVSVRQLS